MYKRQLAGISIVAAHFIPVLVGNAIDLAVGKGNVDISGILGILTVIPILAIVSALFDLSLIHIYKSRYQKGGD